MADPLTDIPKIVASGAVKSSDVADTQQYPIGISAVNLSHGGFKYGDSLGAHNLPSHGKSDDNQDDGGDDDKPRGSGEGGGDDGDDGDDSSSNESGDLEEEGGEEEDEEEDVPPPDTLRDVMEQIKDMTSQKWKIKEQIVEHYPESKEAKIIKRRQNTNVSRASVSALVEDVKNTLITLYVKKDDITTEDFRVRLSVSGGKFIRLVADRFNVKKSKFATSRKSCALQPEVEAR